MGRTSYQEKSKSLYRQIERLSYSALSRFNKSYKDFHRQYVLGEISQEEDSKFIVMGQLVDTLVTDQSNFDSTFLVTKASHPSPQMKTFCELLFKVRTQNPLWEFGDCTQAAYKLLGDNNKDEKGVLKKLSTGYEKYIENFASDLGVLYFQELLDGVGRTLVDVETVTVAENIVKKIQNTPAFQPRGRVLGKIPIMFEYGEDNTPMKCEVDEMDIDDVNKVIYPYDFKVSSFLDNWISKGFLGNSYYIQSGLYKFAIDSTWKHEQNLSEYRVENMAFKVMDYNNWSDPLLYKTTDEHYEQAFNGFYAGHKYFRGIDQLLEEIKFHTEQNNWSMSCENIKNQGEVYIPSFKQNRDE